MTQDNKPSLEQVNFLIKKLTEQYCTGNLYAGIPDKDFTFEDICHSLTSYVKRPPTFVQHISYFDKGETIALSLGIANKSSLWGDKTILLRDEHNGVNIYFNPDELMQLRKNIGLILDYLEIKE